MSVAQTQLNAVDRMRQMTHSVAGRIGSSVLAEFGGGWLGRRVVQRGSEYFSGQMESSVRDIVLLAGVLLLQVMTMRGASLLTKQFYARIILDLTLVGLLASTVYNFQNGSWWGRESIEHVLEVMEESLALLAENLGGFIGLTMAAVLFHKQGIVYWNSENPAECYAVSMTRYQLTGAAWNSMTASSIPWKPVGFLLKTAAYNSNLLLPRLKQLILLIQNKKAPTKILEPMLLEWISGRFLNSKPTPLLETNFKTVWADALGGVGKYILKHIGGDVESDVFLTRLLLQGVKEYLALMKEAKNSSTIFELQKKLLQEPTNGLLQDFKKELLAAVQNSSSAVLPALEEQVANAITVGVTDATINSLTDWLMSMEIDILGLEMLGKKEKQAIRVFLTGHLEYLIRYMCLHRNELTKSDLKPFEDVQLIWDLNRVIVSGYFGFVLSPTMHDGIEWGLRELRECVSWVNKNLSVWIQPGQQPLANQPGKLPKLIDDHTLKSSVEVESLRRQVAQLKKDKSLLTAQLEVDVTQGKILPLEVVKPPKNVVASEGVKPPENVVAPKGVKPPENVVASEGVNPSENVTAPEGVNPSENVTAPEGVNPSENVTAPEGVNPSENVTAPEGVNPPENVTAPEGVNPPGNVTAPEGVNPSENVAAPQEGELSLEQPPEMPTTSISIVVEENYVTPLTWTAGMTVKERKTTGVYKLNTAEASALAKWLLDRLDQLEKLLKEPELKKPEKKVPPKSQPSSSKK
jgi:hypothetical protein